MVTKIEWVTNLDGSKGETWNPITGCTKISTGCRNCYAERMAKRLAGRYGYPEQPNHFKVALHPDKLDQPLHWKKPRMIFVCSMSDLFHENVSDDYIATIWHRMIAAKHHTFQVLTKRPKRMAELIPQLFRDFFSGEHYSADNIWLGVTAENQKMADERIPVLLQIPASVRFVSVEPMLEGMIIDGYINKDPRYPTLNWVICGGETGHGAREMKLEWAWDLLGQCRDAKVPFFFKKAGDAANRNYYPKTREFPTKESEE